MVAYAFRLATLDTIQIRSRHTDDDVITFGVVVNEKPRGQCVGRSPAWTGGVIDMALVPATAGDKAWSRDFVIGPLDLEPDDTIRVFYSVTSVGDTQIPDPDMEKYQIKVMDVMLAAAVGSLFGPGGLAVGGLIGTLLGKAFGLVTGPVETVLGWEPNGPCNGVVLAGSVDLTGAGLARLDYADRPSLLPAGPACRTSPVTRHYDDQTTHDTSTCGAVAQTDLTFEVLQVERGVSVRAYAARRGFTGPQLGQGVRQLSAEPGAVSMRQLLGLRA